MIAGSILRESRFGGMTVDRLQRVNVPLCPLGHAGGPLRAWTILFRRVPWLHDRPVIRITDLVGSQPSHHHVAVGVGSHPGEDIGSAHGGALVHDSSRSPGPAVVTRRGEEDVAVIGPDGVEIA